MILQNQDDDDDDGLMWKTCHTPTNLGDGFCLSGDFIADAVYGAGARDGQQVGLQDQGLPPRQRIPVVSLGCSWCHRGKMLVEWDIN